jgi:flagellin
MATGTQALMSGSAPKTFAFTALAAGETQAITFTTNDSSGKVHTATVSLTHANAGTIDDAIETINNQLQTQQDPVIGNMVAFKDAAGTDLTFASSGTPFTMTLGTVSSTSAQPTLGDGVGAAADQGKVYTSGTNGSASTVDISTATGAQNAVSALATAVQNLGSAQAAVGKGENTLNYAVSLATSQVTNEAAAESQIRDANLAQEAANLSKAQILVQAGTAALAQANSAPQQLLSLLKG